MEHKLITLLRSATAQIHKDLEALPVSRVIMSTGLTVSEYIAYLQKIYTIHYSIEKDVFPVVAGKIADLEQRKKTAQIKQDLEALHATVPAEYTFLDAGFHANPAFCMGMLYVSEGSTLGGQYILKNVQKVLGAEAAHAGSFLNVYSMRTGSMWKAFMDILNTYQATLTDAEMQEVAAGAVYGFERTRKILSE